MACYDPVSLPWLAHTVPCGKCLGCRADQARDWSIRIMHETQTATHAWFLTLTYSEENLPENGSLYPGHLRTFFKALRRELPERISYYACGEYGERTLRPHYHAVLFGPHFLDKRPWRHNPRNRTWRSPTLEAHWKLGNSEIGTVTRASAAYVAGYVRKKLRKQDHPDAYTRVDDQTGELVDVHPEFSRMSLRPAIGKTWIEQHWKEVYTHDRVVIEGKEYKPPRYYDKWMEKHHPDLLILVKEKRDRLAVWKPPEKLAAKKKIHEARTSLYGRRNKI